MTVWKPKDTQVNVISTEMIRNILNDLIMSVKGSMQKDNNNEPTVSLIGWLGDCCMRWPYKDIPLCDIIWSQM